jgi:hypothetical protein
MKLYDCKVRLQGSLYNEVPKPGVTAAEIYLLRHIHGNDAVADITEAGKNTATQSQERERLIEVYGEGLRGQQINKTSPSQALAEIFGIAGRLPEVIEGAAKAKPKTTAPVVEDPEIDLENDGETETKAA